MLLRRSGTIIILESTKEPVPMDLVIACCAQWPVFTGWPQVTTDFIDYVSGMNAVQMRLGPYLRAAEPDAQFGPGYMEVNGKADLTRFNPEFWDGNKAVVEYARSQGKYVFLDIADGWACKHGQWGDLPHPWINNIQGEDHVSSCGNSLSPVHVAWVEKVVQEFGGFDNVVWMDGVEIGLTKDYNAQWSIQMRDIVRTEEARLGYPIKIFGTNGNDDARRGDIDFVVAHGTTPQDPVYNKPLITTEYNPKRPLTADQILAARCLAYNIGSYYSLWRHTMVQSEVDKALAEWGVCTKVVYCVPAGMPESNWGPPVPVNKRKHQMKAAIEAAKLNVGDRCGKDPAHTLSLLSKWLNDNGFCSSGPWGKEQGSGDAIGIQAPDGFTEEWHPVHFGNGCYLSKYKNAWMYKG